MRKLAAFGAVVLIGIAVFAFPDFDWRHVLLFIAQGIVIVLSID